jgi:hypothetical protein
MRWTSRPAPRKVAVPAVIAVADSDGSGAEAPAPEAGQFVGSDAALTAAPSRVELCIHNGAVGRQLGVETVVRRE